MSKAAAALAMTRVARVRGVREAAVTIVADVGFEVAAGETATTLAGGLGVVCEMGL